MVKSIKILNGFLTEMPGFYPGIQFNFNPDRVSCFFGQNGCLVEGTKILTTTGIKNIEDILVGDFVYSEHGNPIEVLHTFNTGVKTVVELKSDRVAWAESSFDHVWLSRCNGVHRDVKGVRVADFCCKTSIRRLYNKSNLGSISYPYSYFIGAMLGDGCCKANVKNSYHISSATEEVVKKISDSLSSNYRKLTGENFTWAIDKLEDNQLYNTWCHDKYAHEKTVDLDILKSWDRQTLLEYVAGVLDTDGSFGIKRKNILTCNLSMQAKNVVDSIEYAMLALWGIRVGRGRDNRLKYKNGPCYYLTCNRGNDIYEMMKELSPYLQVPQKKYLINESKLFPKSEKYIGVKLGNTRKAQTYDIHVDSDTNLYCLANGLVTHNSGKSTLLKMIKSYCGIEKGGWSQISSELALGAQAQHHFPWVYRAYSPASSDCVVDWDGVASFYNDGDIKIDQWAWFTNNEILSEDGMTTEKEQFQYLMDKPSSGQYRLIKLNKLLNMAKNPPDLTKYVSAHPTQRAESNYIRTLPRNGKPCLILDEPERALSLPKQLELFNLLNSMTKDYQIIIATHSPFVLFQKEMDIIDIEAGYADTCIDILKKNLNKDDELLQGT